MNMTEMKINGTPIGSIDKDLLDACVEKNNFSSQEEALIYYFKKGWDFEENDDLNKCLDSAQQEVKKYGFDSIAELMVEKMHKDLRPADEVCKNCTWYDNQFCCYRLCRVSPFEKGCEGWDDNEETNSNNKITEFKKISSNESAIAGKKTLSAGREKLAVREKMYIDRIVDEVLNETEGK